MKIAVTSQGPAMDSQVDARFGRAGMFLIIDQSTGDFETVDNKQNIDVAQGAGIQAAKIVSDTGVDVLITGHCGPKAFHALTSAGIKVMVGAQGTVKEVMDKFEAGELKPAYSPDVQGHWE